MHLYYYKLESPTKETTRISNFGRIEDLEFKAVKVIEDLKRKLGFGEYQNPTPKALLDQLIKNAFESGSIPEKRLLTPSDKIEFNDLGAGIWRASIQSPSQEGFVEFRFFAPVGNDALFFRECPRCKAKTDWRERGLNCFKCKGGLRHPDLDAERAAEEDLQNQIEVQGIISKIAEIQKLTKAAEEANDKKSPLWRNARDSFASMNRKYGSSQIISKFKKQVDDLTQRLERPYIFDFPEPETLKAEPKKRNMPELDLESRLDYALGGTSDASVGA